MKYQELKQWLDELRVLNKDHSKLKDLLKRFNKDLESPNPVNFHSKVQSVLGSIDSLEDVNYGTLRTAQDLRDNEFNGSKIYEFQGSLQEPMMVAQKREQNKLEKQQQEAEEQEKQNFANQIKTTTSELFEHLNDKLADEGFIFTEQGLASLHKNDERTPKQQKLINRHFAMHQLHERIKDKTTLDGGDIEAAERALKTCLNNKPEWSERPFLQKLVDVLSVGMTALYRAFNSKETELEEKLSNSLKPGQG